MGSVKFDGMRKTYLVQIVLYDRIVIHTTRVVGLGMTDLQRKDDAQRQARKMLNNVTYKLTERL